MSCCSCFSTNSVRNFQGNDLCYKCILKIKLQVPEAIKIKRCKLCNEPIPSTRKFYCGTKCSSEAQKIYNKNYWVHNLKVDKQIYLR